MATAKKAKVVAPEEVAQQVEGCIDKFDPAMAKRIREVRKWLRKRFPTAVELVYDNYNFFVIGYCSTERASDCVVSLAADKNGVGLSFYYGSDLADPEELLQGSGSQNRFLRLPEGAKTLKDPRAGSLIDAAEANGEIRMPKEKGYTVMRSISEKQRPRR